MAEEQEAQSAEAQEGAETEVVAKGGKKKLFLGGGLVAVIAAGAIAAMMAVPSKVEKRTFAGPFTIPLFEELFNCNIQESGRTRFLQMSPQATYFSYDPSYMQTRVLDELYRAEVQNTVFQIATRKSLDEIYGEVNASTFMEELRDALDPVLFPVHIGSSKLPWDMDSKSGMRPGISSDKNTFRGRFEDHVLHVEHSPEGQGQLWIDDGPKSSFEPGDFDVRVISAAGEVVFVDASGFKEGFTGAIKIGVQGRIMRILPVGLLVQ